MTNRLLTALLLLFFTNSVVSAQKQRVYESEKQMSLGVKPCFTIDVPGADPKAMEESWESYAKKQFGAKVKKDRKTGEYSAMDVQTKATGKDPGNLYATIEKTTSGAALNFWFDQGDQFLSRASNPNRAEETIRALEAFEIHATRDMIALELAAENKLLENRENELKKLQKEETSLLESIENYKEKIKQAEDKLNVNLENQKAAQGRVDAQKQRTQSVQERLDKVGN